MVFRRMAALALAMMLWAAALAGGVPDGFTFSGGSGRVTISCPEIFERDGETWARLIFSSPNYPSLKAGEAVYSAVRDGEKSVFEIPVPYNEDVTVTATTTAMSRPHEIDYTIRVWVGQTPAGEGDAPAEATPAPVREPIAGLQWERTMPLQYAERFSVDYYAGGYALIDIADGDRVLVIPEDAAVPAGLPEDVIALQKPVQNIYLAATSAMALLDRLDALDAVRLSSLRAEDWQVPAARAAMESGKIGFAGKYSQPDYEALLSGGCELAVESTMIFHTPKVKEMLEGMGIPVLVDRSSYEPHPLGRMEWVKLYGALLGKEDRAEAFFSEQAAKAETLSKYPGTEKTVAFFYIAADGSAVVRRADDYVPRMIGLAGGRYALASIAGPGEARTSVSTTMEQFYAAAVDADYLIYNTDIAGPLNTLDDLFALSPLFKNFKAVKAGQVYVTGRDFYQETDEAGAFIEDVHRMLSGEENMRFLKRLA